MELITTNPDWFNQALDKEHTSKFVEVNGASIEYMEWGNPENKDEYMYMKTYSPYDNIYKANYPSVLVTTSLFDSQVQYFEPAKYVPKLRENSTSGNPIFLSINLVGGHGGKSGRLESLKEIARDYSFILNIE